MDLIIKPTELCNFKCTFCSSTKLVEDKAAKLDLLSIYRFLDRYPDTKTIIVNGGDPLMMKPEYYEELLKYLDDNDLPATLSLTTNLWPFVKSHEKWLKVFRHKRTGIATSFQYGNGRLKGDYSVFTEEDFWVASDFVLYYCGYRPGFIAVIDESNEDSVIATVELAKKMDVVCKVNYAMASGEQSKPYRLSKIYEQYLKIYDAGLTEYEHNTQQMVKRLRGEATICPLTRSCDENIRTIQPEGDYYSCGAFGDDREKPIDFEYEMSGGFARPLAESPELHSLKQSCYSCPMFQICNGCKKTIKDLKNHNMVEEHCKHMKELAPRIIEANGLDWEVTEYVDESID